MHSHLPRLSRLLRASFLALLVLGLIIKPVLTQLSELHVAEHAMAVAAADAHDHDHDSDGDTEDGRNPDRDDHATGAHGLMHQSGGSTTLTGLVPSISVPMVYARMPDLPIPDAIGVPHEVPSSPFRPPIA
jgi:hypothetical protein